MKSISCLFILITMNACFLNAPTQIPEQKGAATPVIQSAGITPGNNSGSQGSPLQKTTPLSNVNGNSIPTTPSTVTPKPASSDLKALLFQASMKDGNRNIRCVARQDTLDNNLICYRTRAFSPKSASLFLEKFKFLKTIDKPDSCTLFFDYPKDKYTVNSGFFGYTQDMYPYSNYTLQASDNFVFSYFGVQSLDIINKHTLKLQTFVDNSGNNLLKMTVQAPAFQGRSNTGLGGDVVPTIPENSDCFAEVIDSSGGKSWELLKF